MSPWVRVGWGVIVCGGLGYVLSRGLARDHQKAQVLPRTVTLAWEAEPRTIDPRYAQDANAQYLEDLVHCSLIRFDRSGEPQGWLAQSWSWQTPTRLEVHLRSNARFSSGDPVTAEDVRATYMFFRKDKVPVPSPRRGAFTQLKDVIVMGPQTLVFELLEPDAAFVSNLIVGTMPAALAQRDLLSHKDDLVGCGPFVLAATTPNQMDLEPNPHYALGDRPRLDRVTIKFVKDETTRYAKLRAGELDLVQNLLSRDKVAQLARKNPELEVLRRPSLATTYLGFNMRDPILSRLPVRQAIAHAIDRDKIIKYALAGMAQPADALLPKGHPFHFDGVGAWPYDPEKARALLDAAGLPDPDGPAGGQPRFALTLKTTTDLTRVTIAKALASELKRVGIAVQVEPLEWGRFKADVDQGRVQMWTLSWIGFKDPDIYRFAFATESFPPNGGNRGFYSSPELDQVLARAKGETNLEKRQADYREAQGIIARDVPYVFLWHDEMFAIVKKRLQGFDVYADGRLTSLSSAYIEQK